MSSIHGELRFWRQHLKQSRLLERAPPRTPPSMPYEGEFIGE